MSVAPSARFTASVVSVPLVRQSDAPLCTFTAPALVVLPLMQSVPCSTVVPPAHEFVPLIVHMPVPVFTKFVSVLPGVCSAMFPAKVTVVPLPPMR